MKKTLFSLLVVAAAVPMTVQADSLEAPAKASFKQPKTVVVNRAPRPLHKNVEYIYITNTPVTGSNIPLVVRRYNGTIDSVSAVTTYGNNELNQTGSLNVGGQLVGRDPAISGVRH